MLKAINLHLVNFCNDWGITLHQASIYTKYNPTDTTDTSPIAFLLDDTKKNYPIWFNYSNAPGVAGFHFNNVAPFGSRLAGGGKADRINMFILCERLDAVNNSPRYPSSCISVCLTHEIFEALADTYTNTYATELSPDSSRNKAFHVEVCDPVEGNVVSINNVYLSDYVLPMWTVPGSLGPWSYSGKSGVTLIVGQALPDAFDVSKNSRIDYISINASQHLINHRDNSGNEFTTDSSGNVI